MGACLLVAHHMTETMASQAAHTRRPASANIPAGDRAGPRGATGLGTVSPDVRLSRDMIATSAFRWGRRLLPLLAVVLPFVAAACAADGTGNYWTFRSEEGGW